MHIAHARTCTCKHAPPPRPAARDTLDVVRGLVGMTTKQINAVEHLLPPGGLEAVAIAAKLPRSNQGRKRQEALVAKMLRGQLTEGQLAKLTVGADAACLVWLHGGWGRIGGRAARACVCACVCVRVCICERGRGDLAIWGPTPGEF